MARAISEFESLKQRAKTQKKARLVLWALILVSLVAVGYRFKAEILYFYEVASINYKGFKNRAGYPQTLQDKHPISLQNFNNNVMLTCENSMTLYSASQGATIFSVNHSFSSGEIRHNNKKIAIFDYASGNLNLYEKFRRTFYEQGKDEVYNVKLAKDGSVIVLGDSLHYASKTRVLNPKNKQTFSWEATDGYAINAAFSPGCQDVVVVSLKGVDGVIESSLSLFNVKTGKLKKRISVKGLILDIYYPISGRIIAVTRENVCFFNSNLEAAGSYEFGGKELVKFEHGSNVILLCFKGYSGGKSSKLEVLNYAGDLLGKAEVSGAVKSIKVSNEYVGALAGEKVFLFGKNMKLKKKYRCEVPIYDFLQIGQNLFVVSAEELSKVKV